MSRSDPLIALIQLRAAISAAILETEGFQYEDFDEGLKAMQKEAVRLFRMFDHYYSDED